MAGCEDPLPGVQPRACTLAGVPPGGEAPGGEAAETTALYSRSRTLLSHEPAFVPTGQACLSCAFIGGQ